MTGRAQDACGKRGLFVPVVAIGFSLRVFRAEVQITACYERAGFEPCRVFSLNLRLLGQHLR